MKLVKEEVLGEIQWEVWRKVLREVYEKIHWGVDREVWREVQGKVMDQIKEQL